MSDANAYLAARADEIVDLEVATEEGFPDDSADDGDLHIPQDLLDLAVALDTGDAAENAVAATEFAEAFGGES